MCSCNASCTGAFAGSAFSHLIVNLDMQDSTGIFVAISHFHHCKLCTQENREKKASKEVIFAKFSKFSAVEVERPPRERFTRV